MRDHLALAGPVLVWARLAIFAVSTMGITSTVRNSAVAQMMPDITWAVDNDGNWSQPANWQGGIVPNANGVVVGFDSSILSSDRTVTLDTTVSVSHLVFDNGAGFNSGSEFTLAGSSGQTLGLATSDITTPSIFADGRHFITADIDGSQGLSVRGKDGSGDELFLTGASTMSGAVTITSSRLVAGHDAALGISGESVLVGAGATLGLQNGTTLEKELTTVSRLEDRPNFHSLSGQNVIRGSITNTSGDRRVIFQAEAGSSLQVEGVISDAGGIVGNATMEFQGDGDFIIGRTTSPGLGSIVGEHVEVVKRGHGTLTIATSISSSDVTNNGSYWGGRTTIESGTLAVISNGDVGEIYGMVATKSGATFDVSDFGTYNVSPGQGLSGAGTVQSQTLGMFDDNFLEPGDDGIGTLTVDGNLSFLGFGVGNGGMKFELADTSAGSSDRLQVTGDVSIAGSGMDLYLTPVRGGLESGAYTIMEANSVSGTAPTFFNAPVIVDSLGSPLSTRAVTSVIQDATTVKVDVDSNALDLVWTGASNNQWNVVAAFNWNQGAVSERFFQLDHVTFDDTSAVREVAVNADVFPASVTFSPTNGDTYRLTGNGGLRGGGDVEVEHVTTVQLHNTGNNFQGTLSIGWGALLEAVDMRVGEIISNGAFVPGNGYLDGDPTNDAATTIVVDGNFVQSSSGLLRLDLFTGQQHDRIEVGGIFSAAGVLEVALLAGANPAVGDEYQLIDADSYLGGFFNVILPSLTGARWDQSTLMTDGTIRVVAGVSGDFNGDGSYDCSDIDALVAEIAAGSDSVLFDMDGDGSVDLTDRDLWLAEAGAANGAGGTGSPYLIGDANFDRFVDVSDLNIWSTAKFQNGLGWCGGDFSADGFTDVSDLNLWSNWKFQMSSSVAGVPEPNGLNTLLLLVGLVVLSSRSRAGRG